MPERSVVRAELGADGRVVDVMLRGRIVVALSAVALAAFTAPMQPWASADGTIRLDRPATARVAVDGASLGSLMAPGWRLVWDGSRPTPGELVVRFTLPVAPADGVGTATEVLQVGRSRARADQRACLAAGLKGARRLPARMVGGIRFTAWSDGDAGMSQQITATDLRAAVDGTCYAVERFRYATRASDADPRITLTQAQGAAMLDASLASLRIGRHGEPLPAPHLVLPPHAVAR